MNNITINQLYPPANGKYHFWHRLFDGAPFDQDAIIGELFSGLEVYAGVHSDNDFDGEVIFAVWCHESNSPLLAKGTVSRSSDALYFKTELPRECRTISLLSVGGNGKSSALWFEPTPIFR